MKAQDFTFTNDRTSIHNMYDYTYKRQHDYSFVYCCRTTPK